MGTLNRTSCNGGQMRHEIQTPFTMRISVKNRNTIRSQIDSLLVVIMDAYTGTEMKTREKAPNWRL
jgi:hypothetical protein